VTDSRRVAFCDLRAAHAARAEETEAALLRVAQSGRYVLGAEVEEFEREFARCCGVVHAVGVGNGTDALALILRASGIGVGDEVIVPAYTAAATWMAVAAVGATPVGADSVGWAGLVDPRSVEAAVSSRTAAIIGVHLFGRLAPMASLRAIARRHGLLLIEDAAHAPGVDEGAGPAGSLADAAAFSFYPTKTLGALGDGGAVSTADGALAESIRRLRSYGWSEWQGQADATGVNSRLDELQAAVLRDRLAQLPRMHDRLRALAAAYRSALDGRSDVGLPEPGSVGEPPWHQFVVRHAARDALRDELDRRAVGTAVHYDPIPPRLRAFAARAGSDGFPRAQRLAAEAISLPFDAWLRDDQVVTVSVALAAALDSAAVRSSALSLTWSPGS
jgi:dTDP-3-amino-3,4,6-trideoxy-alpha-D-glucose transaminase